MSSSASKRSPAISPSKKSARSPQPDASLMSPSEGVVIKRSSQQANKNESQNLEIQRKILPSSLVAARPPPALFVNEPALGSAKKNPTPTNTIRSPLAAVDNTNKSAPNSTSRSRNISPAPEKQKSILSGTTPASKPASSRKVTPSSRQKAAVIVPDSFAMFNSSNKENAAIFPMSAANSGIKSRRQSVGQSVALSVAAGTVDSHEMKAISSAKKPMPALNSPKRSSSPYSKRLFSQPDSEKDGNALESVSELVSFTTNSVFRGFLGLFGIFLLIAYIGTFEFMKSRGLDIASGIDESAQLHFPGIYDNFFARTSVMVVTGVAAGTCLFYAYWRSGQRSDAFAIFDLYNEFIINKLETSIARSEYAYVPVDDMRQFCIDLAATSELQSVAASRNASHLASAEKVRDHWATVEERINGHKNVLCDVVVASDYTPKRSWKFCPDSSF